MSDAWAGLLCSYLLWLTLPWRCCRFKKAVEKGEIDEQELKRQHARQSLERYMHYWQRWAENDSSRKKVRRCACVAGQADR